MNDIVKLASAAERVAARCVRLESTVTFYRNLLCATAFAAGIGNEQPMTAILQESMAGEALVSS